MLELDANGNPISPTATPEKTFTQAELDTQIGVRLERERKKYEGFDELKAKAARLDELEKASLTESEKLKADLEEAKKAGAERIGKAQALLLKAEVKSIAAELGIVDPDAALALMDRSKVTLGDDDSVTGVKEALEALLAAKPYLKAGVAPGAGGGVNPANSSDPKNPFAKETFNLTEQGNLLRKDPAQYARLKAAAKG